MNLKLPQSSLDLIQAIDFLFKNLDNKYKGDYEIGISDEDMSLAKK